MVAIKDINPPAGVAQGLQIQRGIAANANPDQTQGIVDTPQAPEENPETFGQPKDIANKPDEGAFAAFPKVKQTQPESGAFDAFPKVDQAQPRPSAEPGAINPSPANYEDRMAAGSQLRKNVEALSAQRGHIDPEITKQAKAAWDTVAGGYADSHSDDFWKRLMAPLKMAQGAVGGAFMPWTVPQAKVGQALEKATDGLLTEGNLNTAMWGLRPIGGLKPLVDAGGGQLSGLSDHPETGAMKGDAIGTFPPQPKAFQDAAASVLGKMRATIADEVSRMPEADLLDASAAQREHLAGIQEKAAASQTGDQSGLDQLVGIGGHPNEKVTGAAMRDGETGLVEYGHNHAEAVQKHEDAGRDGFGAERGYQTTHRPFVQEEEAIKIAERQDQLKVNPPGYPELRPGEKLGSEDIEMHTPEVAQANVERNLLHAWNEGGVHPAEVAADAAGNPALARDLSAACTPPLPFPPRPSKRYIQEFDDTLNRLRGAHAADQSEFLNLTKSLPESLMNPEVQGEWYKHAEGDPTANMSPADGEAYNKHMLPLKQEEARLQEEVSKSQLDLGPDMLDPDYMHRMIMGKTPEVDRLAGEASQDVNPIYNGAGLMSRTTSSMHARRYFVAENEAGERRVVSINGNELRTVGKQEPGNDLSYSKPDEMDPKLPGKDLRKGDVFPDANGDKWEIKNAYTREIEGATNHKYYQNAIANTIDNIMHLRAASRAIYAVEQLRSTPEWAEYTTHPGGRKPGEPGVMGDNGGPPLEGEAVPTKLTNEQRIGSDWVHPDMPLFHNDLMDPKLANLIDDFWGQRGQDNISIALAKINNFAVSSMFLTPVPHAHNAAVHWTLERSWDWITPGGMKSLAVNGARAMHEVWTQGPVYQEFMRDGSGLLYGKVANHDFYSQLLQNTGMKLVPEEMGKIEAILGWGPGALVKSMYNASARGLWMASDIMMVHRVMELKDLHGMNTRGAIAEAERYMPNYRVPSEILGSRLAQKIYTNPMAFEFSRYHYNVLEGLGNMAKDLAVGSLEQKSHAIGSMMAGAVLMLAIYPALNELLKKVTGNKDLHLGPGGPLRLLEPVVAGGIQATKNLWSKETKDYYKNSPGFLDRMNSILSVAPVAKGTMESLLFNKYQFNGRDVVEPADRDKMWSNFKSFRRAAGQELEHGAQTMVEPYSAFNQAMRNKESPATAITKFTFGLSEHTNDQEMRKQKALHWQDRSAQKRANKGGLGVIEKFIGGK